MNHLLEKFSKVTVKASSLLPADDKVLLDRIHHQYEETIERLDEWRSFFERELQKDPVPGFRIDKYFNGQHYIIKPDTVGDATNVFANINFYCGYDLLHIKDLKVKCCGAYCKYVYQYFKKKYSITVGDKTEEIKGKEKLTYMDVVADIGKQLGSLNFHAIAVQQIIDRMRDQIGYRHNIKLSNKNVELDSYMSYTWRYGSPKLQAIEDNIMLFETGVPSQANLFIHAEFESYNTVNFDSDYVFDGLTKVTGIRFYKNQKVVIKFASAEYAKAFCELIDYETI